MSYCLGIYFDKNIVKYAKVYKTAPDDIEIKEYGIRFVKTTLEETIQNVINDTKSTKDVSIVISAPDAKYNSFQVFKQISSGDVQNVVKLEFEDWCEKHSTPPIELSYVYTLATNVVGDYRKGIMCLCNKKDIEKYTQIGEYNVNSIYPAELLLQNNIPEEDRNYILINLCDVLNVTTVIDGKITYLSSYNVGMKQIIDKFIDVLGSYQKAYEACKTLNVFSDAGSDTNKAQLEAIVEPILQHVLQVVTEDVNKHKESITKLYITGTGTLFTNMDTLFTEYFNIKCEILKPKFITDVGGVRNIAETLESLPAIVLAKEFILPKTTGLEFIKKTVEKKGIFSKIFKKDKNKNNQAVKTKKEKKFELGFMKSISLDKVLAFIVYPMIVGYLAVISYHVFANIYMNQVDKIKEDINSKIKKYDDQIVLARADKTSIDNATNQYKTVNDEVNEMKKQIETQQIGRFTTYNVAAFTQKLIRVIPKEVQLKTITSDDNKKVRIIAQSDNYPSLGYLVANLRLQPDILQNVQILSINNAAVITIEIGGDLP